MQDMDLVSLKKNTERILKKIEDDEIRQKRKHYEITHGIIGIKGRSKEYGRITGRNTDYKNTDGIR